MHATNLRALETWHVLRKAGALHATAHFMEQQTDELNARDIMSLEVRSVGPSCTLQEAANEMRESNVGSLPVCDEGRLVGIVTDRDITVRGIALGADPRSSTVRDVMSEDVVSCDESTSLPAIVEIMTSKQLRRVPVVDFSGRLLGIVSLADIAHSELPFSKKVRGLEGVS